MNATQPDRQEIIRATEADLPAISQLAGVIWRACYPEIITHAQIDYMLARMYALDVLRDEIRSQGIHYDRLLVNDKLVGFASYGPTAQAGVVKLHKLYLLPELHGHGLGSRLLQHVERAVHTAGASRLILSVNKRNAKAIATYRQNGFVIAESVVTDIGNGFVMDDYIMAKNLVA
ncbi:MAG: bifunctional aminotransferase class I/II-fold pyridoxal phosphate-dependent enzyme/GNAT family N-acetyltransferase [Verrucomicrobiota bacterium]|jgi:GNAT superfamily N-acetyltransferase